MRTQFRVRDAKPCQATSDNVAYRDELQRTNGGLDRQEQRPFLTRGSNLSEITPNCLSNPMRQRIEMRASGLQAPDTQHILLPVDIVQQQTSDFTTAQSVGDQKHENGAVPYVYDGLTFRSGQQSQDIISGQSRWYGISVKRSRGNDSFRQTWCAQTLHFGISNESAKPSGITLYRGSTVFPI